MPACLDSKSNVVFVCKQYCFLSPNASQLFLVKWPWFQSSLAKQFLCVQVFSLNQLEHGCCLMQQHSLTCFKHSFQIPEYLPRNELQWSMQVDSCVRWYDCRIPACTGLARVVLDINECSSILHNKIAFSLCIHVGIHSSKCILNFGQPN